jgi:hypothetical protein
MFQVIQSNNSVIQQSFINIFTEREKNKNDKSFLRHDISLKFNAYLPALVFL